MSAATLHNRAAAEIAQGSLFTVNWRLTGYNLGPDDGETVPGFPLPLELFATSIQVTVGQTTRKVPLVNAGVRSIAAVLPSDTPLGQGALTVTFLGEASSPFPIRIVRHAFVIPTNYLDVTGVQNVNSDSDQPFNTVMNSARPGQLAILWGIGLGPVRSDDPSRPLPADLLTGVEVLVGNQPAKVRYAGRSGCCAGVNQIVFETPAGIEGCSVPIAVRFPDGDVGHNTGAMSIAPEGGTCSDPRALSFADRETLRRTGRLTRASFNVGPYSGDAQFRRLIGDPVAFGSGAESGFWFSAGALQPPFGACFAGLQGVLISDLLRVRRVETLDAGSSLTLTGPQGAAEWRPPFGDNSRYSGGLTASLTKDAALAPPGEYTIDNGRGGRDIAPFRASFTLPPLSFQWTNQQDLENSAIDSSQGWTFTWEAGPSIDYVEINAADYWGYFQFTCIERADKGRFTVPPYILRMASGGAHTFTTWPDVWVIGRSLPRSLAIPRLDRPQLNYWVDGGYRSLTIAVP